MCCQLNIESRLYAVSLDYLYLANKAKQKNDTAVFRCAGPTAHRVHHKKINSFLSKTGNRCSTSAYFTLRWCVPGAF